MSSDQHLNKLRYPIGTYKKPEKASVEQIQSWIETIESFSSTIEKVTSGLDEESLNQIYRPGGWTVKQLVHHCADSHMNSFIRFKLCLTEEIPVIKPYFEDRWAEQPDSLKAPVSDSLNILNGLHSRWSIMLNSMSEADLNRELFHPEQNRQIPLWEMLGLYAWHCKHHLTHIEIALNQ